MKIDKNIPMPSLGHHRIKQDKYPFVHEMEIGDSFEVDTRVESARIQSYIHPTTYIRLSGRMMPNGNIRMWRTK